MQHTALMFSFIYISSVGHRCSVSGCGTVLVVDGNMKNHHSVCVEYDGLPKNRFCSLHKPRALTCSHDSSNTITESILEEKDYSFCYTLQSIL